MEKPSSFSSRARDRFRDRYNGAIRDVPPVLGCRIIGFLFGNQEQQSGQFFPVPDNTGTGKGSVSHWSTEDIGLNLDMIFCFRDPFVNHLIALNIGLYIIKNRLIELRKKLDHAFLGHQAAGHLVNGISKAVCLWQGSVLFPYQRLQFHRFQWLQSLQHSGQSSPGGSTNGPAAGKQAAQAAVNTIILAKNCILKYFDIIRVSPFEICNLFKWIFQKL